MKMASFLFLSILLHAAALAYPALFLESRAEFPVSVTILDAAGGSGGGSTGEGSAPQKKPVRPARKALPEKRREQPVAAEPEQVAELPWAISTPVISADADGGIAISAGATKVAGALENSAASSSGESGAGETDGSGGRGDGRGGHGGGSGDGRGNGDGGAQFVQASYAYCPDPDYPEKASREGWKGTVTLRVLVDEAGKLKSLEVNRSSGFAVLDRAALEWVKIRCRFHPARRGERRVESWIRIPVVFRLADLKN